MTQISPCLRGKQCQVWGALSGGSQAAVSPPNPSSPPYFMLRSCALRQAPELLRTFLYTHSPTFDWTVSQDEFPK